MVSAFLGKGLLLSKFLVLGKDFFKSALLCRLSKAQAWGDFTPGSASLHPRFRFASPGVTHGCASPRLGGLQAIRTKRTVA